MALIRTVSALVAIALASTAAFAFQEQTQGGTPQQPDTPAAEVVGSASEGSKQKPVLGTEIRLPGLGRVGTLPRLDFGMELLYGGNDASQPAPSSQADETEGMAIRGSVKHKF